MSFEEIERILGPSIVGGVREAVQAGYVASRSTSDPGGRVALEDLLLAMLVATTITPAEYKEGEQRMVDCVRRLEGLARKTRELYVASL